MKLKQLFWSLFVVSLVLAGLFLFSIKGAFAGTITPPPFECVDDKFACNVVVIGDEDGDSEEEVEAFSGCCKKQVNVLPDKKCEDILPDGEEPPEDFECVHANIQVNPAFACPVNDAIGRLSSIDVGANYLLLMLPALVIGSRRVWKRFKK